MTVALCSACARASRPPSVVAQNQIHLTPENQVKTMDTKPEHNASGNPGGSPEATRRAFNKRFLLDLAEDWQQHGREVFKRVRRESPASYLKVCAMLVPKEVKHEHSTSAIKAMTDEQIEQAIEAIQNMLAAQAGEATKVIEGTAEPTALPAPSRKLRRKRGAEAKASPLLPDEQGESEQLPCESAE